MVQIDDSGSGSLLGGTIIGVLRTETNEYQYKIIPLKYYQGENFDKKEYIHYVVTIVQDIFQQFNVSKQEKIEVCRGYMFEELKRWLKENQYNFRSTKIDDPLQTKIEKSFEDYAISLGLPQSFITYTKYPFHFHRILKWVYADYENRSILCKTGWKSWKKYGNLQIKYDKEIIKNKNLMCLKCHEIIPQNSVASVKIFHSNRLNKIFLHEDCI